MFQGKKPLGMLYAASAVVVTPLVSYGLARLARTLKLPPVVLMLFFGMTLRQLFPTGMYDSWVLITRPLIDMTLAAVGLQIGSHLNADAVGSIKAQMLRFMLVFVPVLMLTVSIAARNVFPMELHVFLPLLGSIAIERSSVECMAGIAETKSQGPFSVVVMAIAALQDLGAIVCFVTSCVVISSGSLQLVVYHLALVLLVTAFASLVAIGLLTFIKEPSFAMVAATFLLTVISHQLHSELLLSSVVAGVFMNYRKQHPTTQVIEEYYHIITAILFSFMGSRIDMFAFAQAGVFSIVALYCARLLGLYLGAMLGGLAAGFSQHNHVRWMALVTQLAIGLSYVTRMEELFPASSAMSRAYGGSILLSLCTGPPLLVWVLNRVGEAGARLNERVDEESGVK